MLSSPEPRAARHSHRDRETTPRPAAGTRGPWPIATALFLAAACSSAPRPAPLLRYVGSSTVANALRTAANAYRRARIVLDTEPESVGGELAIQQGRADLAGVAGQPRDETLRRGIVATPIGRDAIAVIVHPSNPVRNLSRSELARVFTGRVRSWRELGGADVPVRPRITSRRSATRKEFRSAILGTSDYAGCRVVRPDGDIPREVAHDPGAVGQISISFLSDATAVKVIGVDGRLPDQASSGYPITRPLYLLWWPARSRVADFVDWLTSAEASR